MKLFALFNLSGTLPCFCVPILTDDTQKIYTQAVEADLECAVYNTKKIERLVFSKNKFFVDLQDKKLAVVITTNDHDILFHEGISEGGDQEKNSNRWNGVSVSGKNVLQFGLGVFGSLPAIYLYFKRGSKTESHMIGVIEVTETDQDAKDTATAWIKRVNKLYVD